MNKLILTIFTFILISCSKKNVQIEREYLITNTSFNFSKISAQKIKDIEAENHGIQMRKPYKVTLSESYFPDIKKYEIEQPKIFWRDSSEIRNTVSYFFTKKDSIVRVIEYSWSKPKDNDSIISKIFENNVKIISKNLQQKGKITNESKDSWKQQIVSWENDSIYVWTFIFSNDLPQRTRVIIRHRN